MLFFVQLCDLKMSHSHSDASSVAVDAYVLPEDWPLCMADAEEEDMEVDEEDWEEGTEVDVDRVSVLEEDVVVEDLDLVALEKSANLSEEEFALWWAVEQGEAVVVGVGQGPPPFQPRGYDFDWEPVERSSFSIVMRAEELASRRYWLWKAAWGALEVAWATQVGVDEAVDEEREAWKNWCKWRSFALKTSRKLVGYPESTVDGEAAA